MKWGDDEAAVKSETQKICTGANLKKKKKKGVVTADR